MGITTVQFSTCYTVAMVTLLVAMVTLLLENEKFFELKSRD